MTEWAKVIARAGVRTKQRKNQPPPKTNGHLPLVAGSVFACLHRGNEVDTDQCVGCGGTKNIAVFDCALHGRCTASSIGNKNHPVCSVCRDRRQQPDAIPLATYANRFEGQTGWVIGRGRTKFDYAELANAAGPVFFINESVEVEKYVPHDNCFWFALDEGHEHYLPKMRSLPVIHRGGWAYRVPLRGARRVCWWRQEDTGHNRKRVLSQTTSDIESSEMLFHSVGTIQPLIHFAWFTGVRQLNLVGCDGLPVPWDERLPHRSKRTPGHVYDRIRQEADRVMGVLGIAANYVGTPDYTPDKTGGYVAAISVEPKHLDGIDFTCTATRRPDIFKRMLDSFATNLIGVNFKRSTLRINIDPTPANGGEADIINAASRVFGRVVANQPKSPSFPNAVRWCWQSVKTDRFFHLEDDWLLREKVPFDVLCKVMDEDRDLSVINLRAYGFKDERVCLSPGLWRSEHAKRIADSLTSDSDPEQQIRPWAEANARLQLKGARWPDEQRRIIEDIGRQWMMANGWRKNMGNRLTTWESVHAPA